MGHTTWLHVVAALVALWVRSYRRSRIRFIYGHALSSPVGGFTRPWFAHGTGNVCRVSLHPRIRHGDHVNTSKNVRSGRCSILPGRRRSPRCNTMHPSGSNSRPPSVALLLFDSANVRPLLTLPNLPNCLILSDLGVSTRVYYTPNSLILSELQNRKASKC